MMDAVRALCGILLAVSWFYCFLAMRAVSKFNKRRFEPSPEMPFITVMKPLAGAENGLLENLRSFFEQDYPEFELLLAVRSADEPAAAIARKAMEEFPKTTARLIIAGEAPVSAMVREARYDILLLSASNVRTAPDLLRVVSAELGQPGVEMVTCPFRASAGASLWSVMEAVGLNTEFFAQLLVWRSWGGSNFTPGHTIAMRRREWEAMGDFDGWARGISRLRGKLTLSQFVVEYRLGAKPFRENVADRMRMARATRRALGRAYLWQVFANPLPFALILSAWWPHAWAVLPATLAWRALLAWMTSQQTLHDPLTREFWYLLPLQDLASFGTWAAGWIS